MHMSNKREGCNMFPEGLGQSEPGMRNRTCSSAPLRWASMTSSTSPAMPQTISIPDSLQEIEKGVAHRPADDDPDAEPDQFPRAFENGSALHWDRSADGCLFPAWFHHDQLGAGVQYRRNPPHEHRHGGSAHECCARGGMVRGRRKERVPPVKGFRAENAGTFKHGFSQKLCWGRDGSCRKFRKNCAGRCRAADRSGYLSQFHLCWG